MLWLCPVAEHDGHGRKNLYVYMVSITVGYSSLSGVTIILYFTKEFPVDHHAGPAWVMVLEVDKTTITIFTAEVGQILREDVGVQIHSK